MLNSIIGKTFIEYKNNGDQIILTTSDNTRFGFYFDVLEYKNSEILDNILHNTIIRIEEDNFNMCFIFTMTGNKIFTIQFK